MITATDVTQYALEGDQVIGNVETSLFTHFMIEGLRTGQADADRDGRITLNELYDYVYEQVRAQTPHQTPCKWEQAREGEELVIARSRYSPTDLPPDLRQAIESSFPSVREGAVHELGQLLRGSDKSVVRLSRGILKVMAQEDDSQRVRSTALTVLKIYEETKTTKDAPRQDHATPILSSAPQEKTSPSRPLPHPRKVIPAPIVSKSTRRKWFLWGGIGSGILLISMVVYLLVNFTTHPFTIPPLDTPTSTLRTEALASAQTVISLPSNAPPLLATDALVSPTLVSLPVGTLIQPTPMLVLPTTTLAPIPKYGKYAKLAHALPFTGERLPGSLSTHAFGTIGFVWYISSD